MTAPVAPRAGGSGPAREDIVVRRATDDDADLLADLARRTFVETFGPDNTAEDMAIHVAKSFGPDMQRREIRDPRMITLLAELGARTAGFAQIYQGPPAACVTGEAPVEIRRFYVDRPFHGKGIAQAMMHAVEQIARDLGGRTLWLGVWERNPRAIAFYSKCGFVDVGEHAFIFGTEEQTDRVMARAL
ncbi:MAG TPA: GNAT family N-acetyltransferase [Gemmatimonadaceae bacterium]|nr:GNAT family N-acetyltransferase [Gemmatimonadaceae bacterium]